MLTPPRRIGDSWGHFAWSVEAEGDVEVVRAELGVWKGEFSATAGADFVEVRYLDVGGEARLAVQRIECGLKAWVTSWAGPVDALPTIRPSESWMVTFIPVPKSSNPLRPKQLSPFVWFPRTQGR